MTCFFSQLGYSDATKNQVLGALTAFQRRVMAGAQSVEMVLARRGIQSNLSGISNSNKMCMYVRSVRSPDHFRWSPNLGVM
jgi:hypothetical protein